MSGSLARGQKSRPGGLMRLGGRIALRAVSQRQVRKPSQPSPRFDRSTGSLCKKLARGEGPLRQGERGGDGARGDGARGDADGGGGGRGIQTGHSTFWKKQCSPSPYFNRKDSSSP